MSIEERVRLNKKRTAVLSLAFGGVVALLITIVLAIFLPPLLALVIGVAVAGGWFAWGWLKADEIVLDLSDTDSADEDDHARLFNVAAGLCAAMGVPPPALYVVEEPALNALAVGRSPRHASLVFTEGLLEELDLVELEAVTSLLLFKIKAHDTVTETIVIPTIGAVGVLSEMADDVDWLSRVLAWPMPLVEKVLAWVHPSRSEIDTDLAAIGTTRYPPALASALEKMNGRSAIAAACPVTEHLWIAPPLAMSSRRNAALIHAQLPERISVLQEL